jgi:CDP-diglyceride synthetase
VIPIVLAVTYAGGLGFALFVALLAGLGSYELYGITSRSGWRPSRIVGIAASIVLCLSFQFGGNGLPGLVFAAIVLILMVERTARSSREHYLGSLAVTLVAAPLGVRARGAGRSYTFAAGFSILLIYYVLGTVMDPKSLHSLGSVLLRTSVPNLVLSAAGIALVWRVDRV